MVNNNNENLTLVSVCIITYNQESYIRQALESILAQEANFRFELVIGEDCSTDSTRDVCIQYKSQYPDKIKLVLAEKNGGLMKNFSQTLQMCTGKYVAFCSGDDYWIDSLKLQKQVDFMEKHPDFGMTYTDYKVLIEQSGEIIDDVLSTNEKLQGNCRDAFISGSIGVMTITTMIRNEILGPAYFQFIDDPYFKAEDFTLFMWASFDHPVGYLPDETVVYRVHKESYTNSQNHLKKWHFMRSHVYMRKKFLCTKKYTPADFDQLQVSVSRDILTASAKNQVYPQYGIASYRQIARAKQVKNADRLLLLSLYCPSIIRVLKILNRTKIRLLKK